MFLNVNLLHGLYAKTTIILLWWQLRVQNVDGGMRTYWWWTFCNSSIYNYLLKYYHFICWFVCRWVRIEDSLQKIWFFTFPFSAIANYTVWSEKCSELKWYFNFLEKEIAILPDLHSNTTFFKKLNEQYVL